MAELQKRPVIIVGMHRSGTSLIASIIAELGVSMGDSAAPDLYNTTGYFEDLSFLHLNEELLKALGGSWMAPPDRQSILEAEDRIIASYRRFVNGQSGRWGVKDPRLSLFLAPFLKVVEEPLVIYCKRSPDQVARSLGERDLLQSEQVFALKARYDGSVESALEQHSYFTVDYSELLGNPTKIVEALSRFLGVPVQQTAINLVRNPQQTRKEKRKHLSKTLLKDLGKVLRDPLLLFRKRSYLRLYKYVRSGLRSTHLSE